MNSYPHLTRIAMGHFHPQAKTPVKLWKVYSCGQVCFENEDIRLCWHYIRTYNLKTKPTLK